MKYLSGNRKDSPGKGDAQIGTAVLKKTCLSAQQDEQSFISRCASKYKAQSPLLLGITKRFLIMTTRQDIL